MINTVSAKNEQLTLGFTKSGTGPVNILVMGSCRSIPYANYLVDLNKNNQWTVHFIDPFYHNWDSSGNRVELKSSLIECELNVRLLDVLKSVHWFIHENYESYEMFNTNPSREKNIFQFGIKPDIELVVPNYDNLFILFSDVLSEHKDLQAEAKVEIGTMGGLSLGLQQRISKKGLEDVEKFCRLCELFSTFPEMAKKFRNEWMKIRYFWTMNHVTSHFTVAVFRMVIDRLPSVKVPDALWDKWTREDSLSSHRVPVTKYDVDNYGLTWTDPIVDLVL